MPEPTQSTSPAPPRPSSPGQNTVQFEGVLLSDSPEFVRQQLETYATARGIDETRTLVNKYNGAMTSARGVISLSLSGLDKATLERIQSTLNNELIALDKRRAEFINQFKAEAIKLATELLDQSEKQVRKEFAHYGGGKAFGHIRESKSIGGLKAAAKDLAAKRNTADKAQFALSKARNDLMDPGKKKPLEVLVPIDASASPSVPIVAILQKLDVAQKESAKLEVEYTKSATGYYGAFPILAAYATATDAAAQLEKLAAMSEKELGATATKESKKRLENIETVRKGLGDNVFRQQHLMMLVQNKMKATAFQSRAVKDHAAKVQQAEDERKMMWTAIAIGIGVATTLATAGMAAPLLAVEAGVLLAAAAVPAAISASQAYDEYSQYSFAAAAGTTGFDPVKALSHDAPDMAPVAQAVIGAGLDALAVAGAFKALVGAIRAARLSRTAQDLDAAAKIANGMKPGLGEQVLRAAGLEEELAQAAGATAKGKEALGRIYHFESIPGAERSKVLLEAMDVAGVGEVVRRTGKTAEDLIKVVGKDSEVGKRLDAFIALQRNTPPKALEKDLSILSSLDPAIRDEKVATAIDLFGPGATVAKCGGWDSLASLGAGSSARKRLTAWSTEVLDSLVNHMVSRGALSQAEATVQAGGKAVGPITVEPANQLAEAERYVMQMTGLDAKQAAKVVPVLQDAGKLQQLIKAVESPSIGHFTSSLATKEARADELLRSANLQLKELGFPTAGMEFQKLGGRGNAKFNHLTYNVIFDEETLMRADLTELDYHTMMGRALHEITHAKQVNYAMRYRLAQNPTLTVTQLQTEFGMTTDAVAKHAIGNSLSKTSPHFRRAADWHESLYTKKGMIWRKAVYDQLDRTEKAAKTTLKDLQWANERLSKVATGADKAEKKLAAEVAITAEQDHKRAWRAYLTAHGNYKKLPEEAHAWAVEETYYKLVEQHNTALSGKKP